MKALDTAKEALYLLRGIRAFARRRTIRSRRFFHRLIAAFQPLQYRRRRRVAQQLSPTFSPYTISPEEGYIVLPEFQPGLMAEIVAESRRALAEADPSVLKSKYEGGHLLSVPIKPNLPPDHPFVRMALHPDLLGMVSRYLGLAPVVHELHLLYSPNDAMHEQTSQYFHLDGQDIRCIQLFTYIDDVDEQNGPLTLIRAAASERAAILLKYRKVEGQRRVSDETIHSQIDPTKDVKVITGKSGTVLAFDADRCFHYGSRKGVRPRLVLAIKYSTPFAFVLPHDWTKVVPLAHLANASGLDLLQRNAAGLR